MQFNGPCCDIPSDLGRFVYFTLCCYREEQLEKHGHCRRSAQLEDIEAMVYRCRDNIELELDLRSYLATMPKRYAFWGWSYSLEGSSRLAQALEWVMKVHGLESARAWEGSTEAATEQALVADKQDREDPEVMKMELQLLRAENRELKQTLQQFCTNGAS